MIPADGRITYLGINDVHGLAFDADGALWAATTGGVARWDLATDAYTQFTAADGLADNRAIDLAFAPDGVLWIATLGGLSRFDGQNWTSYSASDGLVSDTVRAIAVTPTGDVWVGTTEGVGRFDGSTWTTYLSGMQAWQVDVAPDGALWFASQRAGIHRYDPEQDGWAQYHPGEEQPEAGTTALAVGPSGEPWVYVNWEGVFRLDARFPGAEAGSEQWQKVWDHAAFVCALGFGSDATPWIGTCGSMHSSFGDLLYRQGGTWSKVGGWHELDNPPIRALAHGPGDSLVVGTDRGLALRQDGSWRTLLAGPTRNDITTVAVTPDNTAWFGFGRAGSSSSGGGLARFNGRTWDYDLDNTAVQRLAVAPNGTLWAGIGCSLQRFNGSGWQIVADCDDLGPGPVLDLDFGPDGELWVALGMDQARFDGRSWSRLGRLVHTQAVAPDGTVWVSGREGSQDSFYVARFDGRDWTPVLNRSLGSLVVVPAAAAPDGYHLWATADRGLAHFDGARWSFIDEIGDQPVNASGPLRVAPDAALWLPVEGGVARIANGEMTVRRSAAGVHDLAFTSDGSVWLATGRGAVHFLSYR
jgi:ligand-binding sensor domain-containing protein